MTNKLLVVKNLIKDYMTSSEILHILQSAEFEINYGETISIMGESGSGKSTFLNMIAGLDSVTSGDIFFEGINIAKLNESEMTNFRNKKIGIIFQSHFLLEEFTAIENVMIPFLMNNFDKKVSYNRAYKLLDSVGLKGRINHYPSELSGGEQKRVAIARAFINEPSLILADEPTGNLDKKNSDNILKLLLDISKDQKRALLIVTHSHHIASLADKIFYLEYGVFNKKEKIVNLS